MLLFWQSSCYPTDTESSGVAPQLRAVDVVPVGRETQHRPVEYGGSGEAFVRTVANLAYGGQVVLTERAWVAVQDKIPGQAQVGAFGFKGTCSSAPHHIPPNTRQFPACNKCGGPPKQSMARKGIATRQGFLVGNSTPSTVLQTAAQHQDPNDSMLSRLQNLRRHKNAQVPIGTNIRAWCYPK